MVPAGNACSADSNRDSKILQKSLLSGLFLQVGESSRIGTESPDQVMNLPPCFVPVYTAILLMNLRGIVEAPDPSLLNSSCGLASRASFSKLLHGF